MEEILIVGLNHKTANVEIRECISFSEKENRESVKYLTSFPYITGAVIFSTCNRTEVIVSTENIEEAQNFIINFLSDFKKIAKERFKDFLYYYLGKEAVTHLLCVAGSLDSMIVGEPQILGQVKSSYTTSSKEKCTNVILNKLFHIAFNVAKKIRTQTKIGNSAVSISYAAIELAKKIFGSLNNKRILLIGAGEMAEIVIKHLARNDIKELFVANRTFENAVKLSSQLTGTPIKFEEILDTIEKVDIVISSTASSSFVLQSQDVVKIIKRRKNSPIFFIDIAVPRDIDPEINKIDGAYVYDIDNLQDVIKGNIEDRKKEMNKAKRLVEEAVISFFKWMGGLELVPIIISLQDKIDGIIKQEFQRSLSDDQLSLDGEENINLMINSIRNKILHDPIIFMKNLGSSHRNKKQYLNAIYDIFNLEH